MRLKFERTQKTVLTAKKTKHKKKPTFRPPPLKPKSLSPTKLALLALGFLALIIILGKAWQFIRSLDQPISQNIPADHKYSFNNQTSVNIVFKDNASPANISVLNFDPSQQKITILKIPSDLYTELPRGYGFWRVGSIYDLGQEEPKPVGSLLLKESLAKLLGLPMDAIIIQNSNSTSTLTDLLDSFKKNPLASVFFINSIQSDLTPKQVLSLIRDLTKIRSDKITSLDLATSSITESKLLPDSTRVLGIETVALDTYIRANLADFEISQEQSDIAIYNATDHPGLAATAQREVTNLGGNVIFTSNTEIHLAKSLIIVKGQKNLTAKRLASLYAPWCYTNLDCISDDPQVRQSRAQIIIFLGEDYYHSKVDKYSN